MTTPLTTTPRPQPIRNRSRTNPHPPHTHPTPTPQPLYNQIRTLQREAEATWNLPLGPWRTSASRCCCSAAETPAVSCCLCASGWAIQLGTIMETMLKESRFGVPKGRGKESALLILWQKEGFGCLNAVCAGGGGFNDLPISTRQKAHLHPMVLPCLACTREWDQKLLGFDLAFLKQRSSSRQVSKHAFMAGCLSTKISSQLTSEAFLEGKGEALGKQAQQGWTDVARIVHLPWAPIASS